MKEALLDGDLAAVDNVEALLGSGQALSCHIEYKSLASFVLSSQIADTGTIGCIRPYHGRLVAYTAAIIDALDAHLGPSAARLYPILEVNVV